MKRVERCKKGACDFVMGNVYKQQLSMKCVYTICLPFVMEMT